MAKTLRPIDAARELGVTEETLRRWRRDGIGPPWTKEGKRPRYRSDLLHAGSYAVQGYVETFPLPMSGVVSAPQTGGTAVRDISDLSEAEKAALRAILEKAPVLPLEAGDDLEIHVDGVELDPAMMKALGQLGLLVRASR